jgi:hypothetical protein
VDANGVSCCRRYTHYAHRHRQVPKRAARQNGHVLTLAWVYAYMCRFPGICRRPGQARPHAEELRGLAHEHGLPMRLADGSFYRGWARWCAGDGAGRAEMCEGLAQSNEMYFRWFACINKTLECQRNVDEWERACRRSTVICNTERQAKTPEAAPFPASEIFSPGMRETRPIAMPSWRPGAPQ